MEFEDKKESEVNLLPCNIKYDGPAPVESYFIQIKDPLTNELTSNFRGRKLIGKEIELPEDINGYVLESFNKNNINIHSNFKKLTIWEHDIKPDTQIILNSIDWFDIADIVSYCYYYFLIISNIYFIIGTFLKLFKV